MFLKTVSMSVPTTEKFYEDEIIEVDHPKAGVVIVTLMPSGTVVEFYADMGGEPPGTNGGYPSNAFLLNSQGQTVERII